MSKLMFAYRELFSTTQITCACMRFCNLIIRMTILYCWKVQIIPAKTIEIGFEHFENK